MTDSNQSLPPLWPATALLSVHLSPFHPALFFLSLNQLPLDYWGLWRSIRNTCGGLEAADGKSLVGSSHSFLPKSWSQWGRKTLSEFKERNLLAFYRILFSTEWMWRKERKISLLSGYVCKTQQPSGKLDHWNTAWLSACKYSALSPGLTHPVFV